MFRDFGAFILKGAAAFAVAAASAAGTVNAQESAVPVPKIDSSAMRSAGTGANSGIVDRVVAVVGTTAITWSDVLAAINQQRAQGLRLPTDSAGQMELAHDVLNGLIDEELLIQKARALKIDLTDTEVANEVDRRIQAARAQFPTDSAYRAELRAAGLGSPEEWRRTLLEQTRKVALQRRAFQKLSEKMKPATVTDKEIDEAYQKAREELRKRPAAITFRQVVVPPRPSVAAKAAAKARAEAVLAELKAGGDFELIAKRESADSVSAKLGGDLGWNRRGVMVVEFEKAMFALNPGQLSNVVETQFGYHIIRVDRVQPGEVKARHILIAPKLDSSDVTRAKETADSIAARWRRGVPFDSLVKVHDNTEEKGILQPFPYDSLPAAYKMALVTSKPGDISDPFPLGNPATPKFAVVQVVTRTEPGEYSLAEVREFIRAQIAQERGTRELLDDLRKETYVSIRL